MSDDIELPEPSPTAGMTLGERIEHVGGRTNAAGYIEFGSPMAVDALIQHALRDVLADRERRAQTAPGAEAWQPIETAPKDGSIFLCWVNAERHSESDDGSTYSADASEIDFCQWRADSTAPAGGYHMNMMGGIGDYQEVTHWQPLPAPPAAHSAGKGEKE